MESLWNEDTAKEFENDPLGMRVYTSRLLGSNADLVLHGGGNTSVKTTVENIFGEEEEILYVKGSGWDLATIEKEGFAPVKMEQLLKLAKLESLSDSEMVRNQRMAMTDPNAPNPSVEAILHAIIPFSYVDHTHADAVVAVSNTPKGEAFIKEIYGSRILIIPYVMPGFILARKIYEMTRDINWNSIEGMILMHHGVFTFSDDARESYEKMIELVTMAEDFVASKGIDDIPEKSAESIDAIKLARVRKAVSDTAGMAMLSALDASTAAAGFSSLDNVRDIIRRGPLTPDHIIRTKRIPVLITKDPGVALQSFQRNYTGYFNRHNQGETMLDPAPRWGVIHGVGTLAFGPTVKHLKIINDIVTHTRKAIYQAERLGGWKALPEKDLFEMEYWELEQAKLKKAGAPKPMQGRVALVTGAASGIGKACVEALLKEGATITALDIDEKVTSIFQNQAVLGLQTDMTDDEAVQAAIETTIQHFGGLDMIVSNAGIFPPSQRIDQMEAETWEKSLNLNLTSHQRLLKAASPFLKLGIDPALVVVGSKNVPAPGPGAGAYSVAKAGLTQLVRMTALEWGEYGIRINAVHPNAVYDTAIWTDEVLESRARHYGLTVEEYKTNNVLKKEVSSHDVARLVVSMLGEPFAKVTGAQVPVDGGNERVI